jgi:carbonic anhydrase
MSGLNLEDMMTDVDQGMGYLRNLADIDQVVILGHSDGGAMMVAYQNTAENGASACQTADPGLNENLRMLRYSGRSQAHRRSHPNRRELRHLHHEISESELCYCRLVNRYQAGPVAQPVQHGQRVPQY